MWGNTLSAFDRIGNSLLLHRRSLWFLRVPPLFARHRSREYQPCELQLWQEHFWSDEAEGCRREGLRRSLRAARAITGRVTRVAIDVNSPLAVDPRVMFRPPSRTRLAAVGCTSRHGRLPPRNEADSWADSPSSVSVACRSGLVILWVLAAGDLPATPRQRRNRINT